MAGIVHEAQDTHLCALFIGAHGDTGDYKYALDAANSAAKHLLGACQVVCVWGWVYRYLSKRSG